eukprot:GGOE01065361.1.p1 GENE.GGOE01065361.1~~GGOE01065361.1.p1  ORF type:complete len:385 (-),score=32.79 GGOE01065361.1:175-1329(-)
MSSFLFTSFSKGRWHVLGSVSTCQGIELVRSAESCSCKEVAEFLSLLDLCQLQACCKFIFSSIYNAALETCEAKGKAMQARLPANIEVKGRGKRGGKDVVDFWNAFRLLRWSAHGRCWQSQFDKAADTLHMLINMVGCASLQMACAIARLRCKDGVAALALLKDAFEGGAGFAALSTAYWMTWPSCWNDEERNEKCSVDPNITFSRKSWSCFTTVSLCHRIVVDLEALPRVDQHSQFFLNVMTGKAFSLLGDVESSMVHLQMAAVQWPLHACLAADRLGLHFHFAPFSGSPALDGADALTGFGEEVLGLTRHQTNTLRRWLPAQLLQYDTLQVMEWREPSCCGVTATEARAPLGAGVYSALFTGTALPAVRWTIDSGRCSIDVL